MKNIFIILLIMVSLCLGAVLLFDSTPEYLVNVEIDESVEQSMKSSYASSDIMSQWKSFRTQLAAGLSSAVGVMFYVIFGIAAVVWLKMTWAIYRAKG